jgi:putative membrane protein
MTRFANLLIGLVALLHIGFMVLEMFLWNGPVGQRVFGMTPEFAAASAVLAANQGLYNGILAAGLIWSVWEDERALKIFFLMCIVIAGVFGGLSAKISILYTQAAPAAAALLAVLVSRERTGS